MQADSRGGIRAVALGTGGSGTMGPAATRLCWLSVEFRAEFRRRATHLIPVSSVLAGAPAWAVPESRPPSFSPFTHGCGFDPLVATEPTSPPICGCCLSLGRNAKRRAGVAQAPSGRAGPAVLAVVPLSSRRQRPQPRAVAPHRPRLRQYIRGVTILTTDCLGAMICCGQANILTLWALSSGSAV